MPSKGGLHKKYVLNRLCQCKFAPYGEYQHSITKHRSVIDGTEMTGIL